jgi:hypothetical protein
VKLREEGLPAVLFGQGFASMSAPSKELERLVIDNAFDHGGHPVLRQHAKVCAVETDPAGNIKPSKEGSSQRIDGIVAGHGDRHRAARPGEPEESVYEKIGPRTSRRRPEHANAPAWLRPRRARRARLRRVLQPRDPGGAPHGRPPASSAAAPAPASTSTPTRR